MRSLVRGFVMVGCLCIAARLLFPKPVFAFSALNPSSSLRCLFIIDDSGS